MMIPLVLATEEASYKINIFEQIVDSRGVVLATLLVLIAMSLVCWFIMGYKWFFFRRIRRESEAFLDLFWRSDRLEPIFDRTEQLAGAPVSKLFRAGYVELSKLKSMEEAEGKNAGGGLTHGFENVERALRRAATAETTRLERLVSFLATTGSTAPFIGLFGTVWGIMKAFAYIRPDRPILETVTPHIAQALVATAIGLLAAIPAVMAYNYFVNRIKVTVAEMDNFASDFLNILRRHFFE